MEDKTTVLNLRIDSPNEDWQKKDFTKAIQAGLLGECLKIQAPSFPLVSLLVAL
jgi:hypothetical protein